MCYTIPGAYPELFALVGGKVPDYRGLFLRGLGGNSAGLGVTQGDAIRNITGTFYDHHSQLSGGGGVFGSGGHTGGTESFGSGAQGNWYVDFNAARVVPTANENRPVNQAVRYFIRAKS